MTGLAHAADDVSCSCRECQVNTWVVIYMMHNMEPTDRALRPAGDICPAEGPAGRPGGVPRDTFS